jgi:hypothetical protein
VRGGTKAYRRTHERRAQQAMAIRGWRPWEHSTGSRTLGKAKSSRNACRGGHRQAVRQFARLLRRLAAR